MAAFVKVPWVDAFINAVVLVAAGVVSGLAGLAITYVWLAIGWRKGGSSASRLHQQ